MPFLLDAGSGTLSTKLGIERVTPLQMMLLAALGEKYPGGLRRDGALFAMYGGEDEPDNAVGCLHIMINRMRPNLERLGLELVVSYKGEYRIRLRSDDADAGHENESA